MRGHRQCIVIGSGPGGSITASVLSEAGYDVLVLEEGRSIAQEATTPFSMEEMAAKYRNRGANVAIGSPILPYAEGCVVGGGSEVNAGLYHRTPPEILERWKVRFALADSLDRDLAEHFEQCERELNVSLSPEETPRASLMLARGAEALGWKVAETPRWVKDGRRQSMSVTFLRKAIAKGAELAPESRVTRIRRSSRGHWEVACETGAGPRVHACEHLFVCAGAVQTPFLLLKSGIRANIGRTLGMHPTLKLICQFPEIVNTPSMAVPGHQVKEFAPRLSFGCSISSPPHLAMGLMDYPEALATLQHTWEHMTCYYVMVSGESTGRVLSLPGFGQPVVRYNLSREDALALAEGLRNLAQLGFAAGADRSFPSVIGVKPLTPESRWSGEKLDARRYRAMTIHLFGSCPMGEDVSRTAVNSFGRVHGLDNLFLADGSILCGSPSVNPQGTIMAFALRNAKKFVNEAS